MDPKLMESAPESWDQLLAEMAAAAASHQPIDIKTFLLKTKAMVLFLVFLLLDLYHIPCCRMPSQFSFLNGPQIFLCMPHPSNQVDKSFFVRNSHEFGPRVMHHFLLYGCHSISPCVRERFCFTGCNNAMLQNDNQQIGVESVCIAQLQVDFIVQVPQI